MFEVKPNFDPVTIDCPVLGRLVKARLNFSFYADTGDPETSFHMWGVFNRCESSYNMDSRCAFCHEYVNRVLHQADVPPVIRFPQSF